RATGTHCGERLVTGGVDERDRTIDLFVLGPDLVRTDVLGDATGLTLNDVGLTDRVEKAGLTVVDVTHDGDDRRTDFEVVLALRFQFLVKVEAEALEELLVLIFGRDHLDLVAELLAEDLERRLVQRFGGCSHLTEVEEDRHKGAGLNGVAGQRLALVCEVRDGCAAAHTDGLAVAAGDVDATDDRCRPHLELLPLRPTRLALLGLAAALTEGTSCATTRSATTASAAAWA